MINGMRINNTSTSQSVGINKNINTIMIVVMYLTFCASFYFNVRGTVGFVVTMYGLSNIASSVIVAFLYAGILPTLFVEILCYFVFRILQDRIQESIKLKYYLRFFVSGGSLVVFFAKLVFYINPFFYVYANAIVEFLGYTIAFGVYVFYCGKKVVKAQDGGIIVTILSGSYLAGYGMLMIASLFL